MLKLILVRHGQTMWNAGSMSGEHFRGQIDVDLNAVGWTQAQAVADRLAGVDVAAVYASPLQRAIHTAASSMAPESVWATDCFITRDPNDILIDVIQNIAPTGIYAER